MAHWKRPVDYAAAELMPNPNRFHVSLGGQFRLDPDEINAWGTIGPFDDTNTQDLGAAATTAYNRNAGGFSFPWDVQLRRFRAWHRNSDDLAEAWGWVIARQAKTAGSNATTDTTILHEVNGNAGVGPRNYLNNTTQETDLDLSAVVEAQLIPAGEVLVLGVSAPTADQAGNYNVQIMSGYFELERLS